MRANHVVTAALLASLATSRVASASEDSIDTSLTSSIDTAKGLRADAVAERAVSTSPELRARNAAVEGALAAQSQAELDFLPKLTTTARYNRLSPIDQPTLGTLVTAPGTGPGPLPAGAPLANVPLSIPVILNQSAAQAQLSIPVSDYLLRLTKKLSAANEAVEAARLQGEATRLVVATNAKITYYEWVRSRLQLTVAEKGLTTAKGHLRDAESAFSAGATSNADVLRAQSQEASSELVLVRAQNGERDAEDRLRTVMHDPNADLRFVGEDVRIDQAPFDTGGNVELLFTEALGKRRELRALGHTAASLERQASAARALYFPRLDGVAEATYANPNQRIFPQSEQFRGTWSAGVVLSWSPNDALAGGQSVRAAEAKEAETRAQLSALRDQLRSEVVSAFHSVGETQASLASSRRGVAAAEEGHRVRLALYRAGRATGTELTDAENDLTRARFGLVNAYIDARLARVRLIHAVGRD